ncbi:MAG: protein kinase [Blastocatellia bacterium]|nr:protein kinase [Blastocatellia bacterium]
MIGQEVGSYKITDKIGEGGMGTVFKGIDVMLEREVAIKMLRPELSSQADVVERFRTEAVTLAKLNHPNIATLFSFLREGEDYFMVMEFVRGETLDEVLRKRGAMNFEQAVTLFCHALEGIDHAHRLGVIHRDIKPANMMLTDEGMLKVMDFGIARMLGTSRMTKHGNIIGTIEYMSPEQVQGEETDARSDIYSLGILLYEMLTGRVPFRSKSEFEMMRSQIEAAPPPPTTFAASVPLPVEEAIMRAMAKKPEARFQTANQFRAHLLGTIGKGAIQSGSAVYAAPATRMMEPFKPPADSQESNYATKRLEEVSAKTKAEETTPLKKSGDTGPGIKGATGDVPSADQTEGASPEETVALPANYMHRIAASDQPAQPEAVQSEEAVQHEEAAAPQASLMSKLNWKHYAAASVVLLLLISVPLALIGGGSQEASTETPTTAQPAENLSPSDGQPSAPNQPATPSQPADTSPNPADTAKPSTGKPDEETDSIKEGKGTAAKKGDKQEAENEGGVKGLFKKMDPRKLIKRGEDKDDKKKKEKKP